MDSGNFMGKTKVRRHTKGQMTEQEKQQIAAEASAEIGVKAHENNTYYPDIAKAIVQSAIEKALEQIWKDTKGVNPETGKMWLTPRMERDAAKLEESWAQSADTKLVEEIAQESALEYDAMKYKVIQMTTSTWEKLQARYAAMRKDE